MDPFRRVKSGEVLPGLPAPAWNALLDRLKPAAGGVASAARGSPVEFLAVNTTGSPLTNRFGILQPTTPLTTYSADSNQFFEQDIVKCAAPAAGSPFVVFQEPVSAGGVGFARALGYTRAKVNVVATSDKFADCTTATDKLTSGTSGPARILWVESDTPGPRTTGDQWGVVELVGAAGGATAFSPSVQFLNSAATPATVTSYTDLGVDFTSIATGWYLFFASATGQCDAFGTANTWLYGAYLFSGTATFYGPSATFIGRMATASESRTGVIAFVVNVTATARIKTRALNSNTNGTWSQETAVLVKIAD